MMYDGTKGDGIAVIEVHEGPLELDGSDQASNQMEQMGGTCTTQ